MTERFRVLFLEEAAEFLNTVDLKAREKIIFNIRKAQVLNDKELFKKLSGEIWEFRTLFNKTHYRFFAFWDKTEKTDTLVISTHGIIKKTDKTPVTDLNKAENSRKLYFEQKFKTK
jgi:phage-related protein